MKWFENAYDRAHAAEFVLQAGLDSKDDAGRPRKLTEEYIPGFYRTSWSVSAIGGMAILQYHPFRMVFNRDEGYDEPIATPYFRAHFTFRTEAGEDASAVIEFDENFAYLKRSSEYTNPRDTKPEAPAIWDEAMSVLDVSLAEHAGKLGWLALPQLVNAIPKEQVKFVQAA